MRNGERAKERHRFVELQTGKAFKEIEASREDVLLALAGKIFLDMRKSGSPEHEAKIEKLFRQIVEETRKFALTEPEYDAIMAELAGLLAEYGKAAVSFPLYLQEHPVSGKDSVSRH